MRFRCAAAGMFALLIACAPEQPQPEPDLIDEGPGADIGDDAKGDLFGNAEAGEACSYDWQCNDDMGLVCVGVDPDRVCQLRSSEGQLCDEDDQDDCATGLRCVGTTCVAPRSHHESCGGNDLCGEALTCRNALCEYADTCTSSTACSIDDVCRPNAARGNTFNCQARGTRGQACVVPEHCERGLFCEQHGLDIGTCISD